MAAQQYMVERIARVCHEANRATQIISGDEVVSAGWTETTDDQRESAMEGVRVYLDEKLTPEQMHAAWSQRKLLGGWVYGQHKDEVEKTHPCLVAYADLDEAQRLKDRLFINIIKAFQEHADAEGLFGL